MKNFAVKISFLGTDFHGFQRQQNAHTVEAEITGALFKILGEKTEIFGCSRTDKGVSALEYVFNFKTENKITPLRLKSALNHFLPDSIAVLKISEVDESFHARYSCIEKEYRYIIRNSKEKCPFSYKRKTKYGISELNAEKLNQYAQSFLGEHDFSAFCSMHDGAKSHIRNIKSARVFREGEDVIFEFRANGFLYNMVRIMVGTLVFINEGKIKGEDLPSIIQSKNRKLAGKTAAADGLYLKSVFYETDIFKEEGKNG